MHETSKPLSNVPKRHDILIFQQQNNNTRVGLNNFTFKINLHLIQS